MHIRNPNNLVGINDQGILRETNNFLSEMKDFGEVSYVIGVEVYHDSPRGLLWLSQKVYIKRVLE